MVEKINSVSLEAEIARLLDFGLPELRARWLTLYGRPAPVHFRRKFLARAVAHQIQIKAFGDLSEATKGRLREIAVAARNGTLDSVDLEPRIRAGTKLIRTWKKVTHEVIVLDDGFYWRGQRYSSLSTIAKTIAGTSWNGWRFFGIKRPTAKDGFASSGKFVRPTPDENGKVVWPRTRAALARRKRAAKAGRDA